MRLLIGILVILTLSGCGSLLVRSSCKNQFSDDQAGYRQCVIAKSGALHRSMSHIGDGLIQQQSQTTQCFAQNVGGIVYYNCR